MFFSEEKNQKTFNSALADACRPWPESWDAAQMIKVFCFFSSEKKAFLSLPSLGA
jgi:hypothetical protein